jgi:hypothetical protein
MSLSDSHFQDIKLLDLQKNNPQKLQKDKTNTHFYLSGYGDSATASVRAGRRTPQIVQWRRSTDNLGLLSYSYPQALSTSMAAALHEK